MESIGVLTVLSCLLTLLLTPVMRDWSIRLGWVDRPDQGRKLHSGPIPRTGGAPILVSYIAAYCALFALPRGSGILADHLATIFRLLPPVAIVFVTGLLDDRFGLKPWHKLAGEFAAAVWMYAAGVRIVVPGHAPWWSFPLTVGWLILCANAFNLIDGVDGLAAGVGLTATLTTFIAGMLHDNSMLGLATAPLAGCLLGFLRYNFNPASIFLGDSGSLLIGFLLGTYGMIWSQKSATMLGLAAPAMALALPLLEVSLSIVRRFLRNEPIFSGDRGHIHHLLLDRGFTPRRVALLLYGAGGVGAALSLLQSTVRERFTGAIVLLFAAVVCTGVRYLGYAEFPATRRFLLDGLRPILSAHVKLELLDRSLRTAHGVEQCWEAIERAGRSLGYSRIAARLAGIRFSAGPSEWAGSECWQMRLNLQDNDYVNITQCQESPQPVLLAGFVDVVCRVLPGRLAAFRDGASPAGYGFPRNSSASTVISSDCAAPSVKAATASWMAS